MAHIYRKSALEKLSNPDQLDKTLTVISPMSWLALAAVTVMIAVTLIWSIVGRLPTTITTKGIIAAPSATNAVYMEESGEVLSVNVYAGSVINKGDLVLTYKVGTTVKELRSDQTGTVYDIKADLVGKKANQGDEVIRVSPLLSDDQVVVCYIKWDDAKKVEEGMLANITLSSADSQTYGHMMGRAVNVDSHASSTEGMGYVLGNNNNLAADFQENGSAVVAVTFQIGREEPDHPTASGYFWSNEKGRKLSRDDISNGTKVSVKVIIEEVPPMAKLFTKVKELWGD